MKKIFGAGLLCAALLTWDASALDLILKNGRTLPDVTIISTTKNKVTLVSTSNGTSTLRDIRFSELSTPSLAALRQYLMESINSYMEPVRPTSAMPRQGLMNMQQYARNVQQNELNNSNLSNQGQGQLLFSAAPAMTISMNPVFPNQVTVPPPQNPQQMQPNSGNSSPIILPTFPHNINFFSLGMITSGSLGVATSAGDNNADGPMVNHYGRIYLYGVSTPQGGDWTGIVYPTTKTIIFNGITYPCYATSQAVANQISSNQ